MRNKITVLTALCIAGLFLLVSCDNNTPSSSFTNEPPQLPPASSMEVDLSMFEEEGGQPKEIKKSLAANDSSNFLQAAVRAIIMKAAVDLNLAIPRALLEAAENSDAELNDDEEWVWSFSQTAGDAMFEVRFVASRLTENQVQWQLFVSSTAQNLEDQLFFEGTTTNQGTEGIWVYYDLLNSESEEPVSQNSWNVSDEEDVSLRLEVLTDQYDRQGDYLEYTFDGTVKNAVYNDASEEITTEIQWNVETHEGYLIAPDYNNGEQACWDSNLENTACS